MESQLACLSTAASGALNALPGTPPPGRRGTAHENISPYQAFKCKDGEYFVIGMLQISLACGWHSLIEVFSLH